MDRTVFFDRVRAKLAGGKLTTGQVQGFSALLDAWTGTDIRQLAYVLATAWHETAATMQPIAEYGKGKGRPYGAIDSTGKAPYGRGYVQLTWRDNYVKADQKLGLGGKLAADYDLAMRPDIAAKIIVRGMIEGWFTSKKLSDYIGTKADYKGARRIVNGTDKAALIAGYAATIEAALRAAGADKPVPVSPVAKPEIIVMQPATPQPARNPIAAFFAAMFGWPNVGK